MADQYSNVQIYHFIHSSVDGNLGCLHVLAIVNTAATSIDVCAFQNCGLLRVSIW